MQAHSTKPTRKAVANTGGISEKPTKAFETAGTVKPSSTSSVCACLRPTWIFDCIFSSSCRDWLSGRIETMRPLPGSREFRRNGFLRTGADESRARTNHHHDRQPGGVRQHHAVERRRLAVEPPIRAKDR